MVVGILVLQMVTTVAAGIAATRLSEDAARDTFSYVGDLTAERVARYAEAARDVVDGTTAQIQRTPEIETTELLGSIYQRLVREPSVRAIYVGRPDGSYLVVRRDGSGFDVQIGAGPGEATVLRDYDARFKLLGETEQVVDYDPRERPWYLQGSAGGGTQWTDPYV